MYTGKAVIIGDGAVGSAIAYTLTLSRLFSRISLIDIDKSKAEGDALDISHGVSFLTPVRIEAEDYDTCRDADIIIITAGVPQKSGETRIDLLKRNFEVFKSIVGNVIKYCHSEAVILVVTNPVDILTYATWKLSGMNETRIIGSGTVLDTSRLKYLISQHLGVDMRNVSAYVLGEHGDGEVAAWTLTQVAGMKLEKACAAFGKTEGFDPLALHAKVVGAAYEIIDKKGATFYAVALAVRRIVEAMVRDEHSVLTVSSLMSGSYGISDVCMSLPTVVGRGGVLRVLETPLSDEECAGLKKNAEMMRSLLDEMGL